MKTIRFLLLTVFLSAYNTYSQSIERQTIASSGNFNLSDGVLIRQTIGQAYFTQSNYTDNISFRPGFQQPEIKTKAENSSFNITLLPNPTTNFVQIKSSRSLNNVNFYMYDNLGELVFSQNYENFTTQLFDCQSYPKGVYLVHLVLADHKYTTSKLIIY